MSNDDTLPVADLCVRLRMPRAFSDDAHVAASFAAEEARVCRKVEEAIRKALLAEPALTGVSVRVGPAHEAARPS